MGATIGTVDNIIDSLFFNFRSAGGGLILLKKRSLGMLSSLSPAA